MYIDFHTHVFPDKIAEKTIPILANKSGVKPYTNGTINGLLKEMTRSEIDISVVLPVVTSANQFDSITRFAKEINETSFPDGKRIISFAGMHPECEDVKGKIRQLKQNGFRGIKLHPDYQKTKICDIRYKRIIEEASGQGLIVTTHAGIDIGMPENVHCTPDMVLDVIKDVAPEGFVLAHLGGWNLWNEIEEKICGQNVYMDLAVSLGYCKDEQVERIVKKHGANRILFATDSPWAGMKEMREHLESLQLTKEEKEWISYKSAAAILAL